MNVATRTAGFGDEVKRRIMLGTYVLSAGYMDAYYNQALRARTRMIAAFASAYARCDVLIGPTSPTTAFPLGSKTDDLMAMYRNDVCTIPSNLTGEPAVSVPFGAGGGRTARRRPGARAVIVGGHRSAGGGRARGGGTAVDPCWCRSGPGRRRAGVGGRRDGRLGGRGRPRGPLPSSRPATKLFCGCLNAFGDEPNTNICPTCVGLPGSLPVLNRRAVELAMAIGTALDCEIRPSTFHRKNYFYPDQAKDYQISQYDEPINVNGCLELPDGTRWASCAPTSRRTPARRCTPAASGRIHGADYSLVDYNRSGVPLVEIVSAPDLRSSEQARAYVTELRGVLVASGASDGKMEEGSMRVDANVSVRRGPDEPFGTRCEIKNLNSVRSVGRAIDYEAERQAGLLESGQPVVQETRHWDEDAGRTVGLRSKEEAYDYRYFLEPDLVPLEPDRGLDRAGRRGRRPPASGPPRAAGGPARRRRVTRRRLVVDQVGTVVGLGLDDLVVEAVAAGVPAALALSRTANEAANDAEAARRLSRLRLRRAPLHGGRRIADDHAGQGGACRPAGRPGRRSGGRGRRPRVRGHERGLAGFGGGRGGGRPSRGMGAVHGRWREGRQADRLLHRPRHADRPRRGPTARRWPPSCDAYEADWPAGACHLAGPRGSGLNGAGGPPAAR